MKSIPLGLYQHYKGPLYEVMDIALHSESEEAHVVYRPLYGDFKTWIRPFEMFTGSVKKDNETLPRFRYLGQNQEQKVTLYHTEYTRSSRIKLLLNIMGIPYTTAAVDLKNKSDEFLALTPYGTVPLLTHGDTVIYESGAIALYLADQFPKCQMAPPLNSPTRGLYYQWMMVILSHLEPLLLNVLEKRAPLEDLKKELETINSQQKSPYLLGQKMSAVDVLWWAELWWMQAVLEINFNDYPHIKTYYDTQKAKFEHLTSA